MEYMQTEFRNMHPSMLFDLQKYYPTAMQRLEEHKQENMEGYLLRNIERGKEELLPQGFRRQTHCPASHGHGPDDDQRGHD